MAFDLSNKYADVWLFESRFEAGFAVFENVLTADECDKIAENLDLEIETRSRAGARHLMMNPTVNRIASDPRLLKIARTSLGLSSVPFRATLFEKTGKANWLVVWHQDTALPLKDFVSSNEWGPWSAKDGVRYAHAPTWALNQIVALRIHLDDSTTFNGPLRVVPRSHRFGVLDDEQVFKLAHNSAVRECSVGKGGILAMRPLLIHASSKVKIDAPRRVLHIEYASSTNLGYGVQLEVC